MKKTSSLLTMVLALCGVLCAAESFEKQFQNPPDETKPWCYWYWYKSDITRDGITKDLEAMKKAGIRLAMIGNIEQGNQPSGPVKMFSPEWKAATKHALSEAARLGIEIYMFNSPGCSQSGGPWIKPEQSMRRVTWNEVAAKGGAFSAPVRNALQDIAVLAVPKKKSVSVSGVIPPVQKDVVSLANASWIWHSAEDGANNAPAGTKYFKKVFQADPTALSAATMMIAADNSYVAWVNGKEVVKGTDWKKPQQFSITPHLKPGNNVISVAVTNAEAGPSGLIAALMLDSKGGKQQLIPTDATWSAGTGEAAGWREDAASPQDWKAARVLGAASMNPWQLPVASKQEKIVRFEHSEPFTARGLTLVPKAPNWAVNQRLGNVVMVEGKLYALNDKGARTLVAEIKAVGSNPFSDFLPLGPVTYSLKEATAKVFEFEGTPIKDVVEMTLGSDPLVAHVVEKQLGRMHATPSPTWESYLFPDTEQPADATAVLRRSEILNLTDKLDANGVLTCELPPGDWTILYFGMVTTGKRNYPAPPEGTGLECDKMSKEHIRYNFNSMFNWLLKDMTATERKAFKGITVDSYEAASQNWTDGFGKTFAERNGYDPIQMLPVLTGRVVESAKDSDGFLSDLRRTVSQLIAENYVGGLRDVAREHGLRTWHENYGHWGFPGEFLTYGGYADQVGGEFWSRGMNFGNIECRAASSAAHIYGKQSVFAEAFTSINDSHQHPYTIKRRGEELFCEGINHFVLHVSEHQPRDGVPGVNVNGTAFHRNTPWFGHSRAWSRYLQRCHFMLRQGEPVADTAVYIGDFAPQMTGPAKPVPPGYDYDYINSDALLRKVRVEGGELVVPDENNPARVSTRYQMVAMPTHAAAQSMRPQVRARIEELKKQGAKFVEGIPVAAQKMQELKIAPLVSKESGALRWKARRLNDGMIFFLSNFAKPGPFEVTLRASGKAPELFNPVTGETRKIARFWPDGEGTRVELHVKDPADSFFIVFRDKLPSGGSVVKSERDGKSVSAAQLELYFDDGGKLIGQSAQPGTYTLQMSNGAKKQAVIAEGCEPLVIKDGWTTVPGQEAPNTLTQELVFNLPETLAKADAVKLDLGKVNVMATVTLNGKEFETLWMPPFEIDVTKFLKPGQNRLRVKVVSTSPTTPSFGPKVSLLPILSGVFKTQVSLPRVFGSKMILQRDRPVPIWGMAEAGQEVTVAFAGQVKKTKADASGKWSVKLDPMAASTESRTMTVKGKNEVRFDDVLVGEVWLASGQSNMQWTWGQVQPEQRLYAQTHKDNRFVRALHLKCVSANTPQHDIDGAWKDCAEMVSNPEKFHSKSTSNPIAGQPDIICRIEDEGVSAVGFFFAAKLQKELGVPVAFISSAWGGMPIECFIPQEAYPAVGLPLPKPGDRAKTVSNAMILPLAPYALRGAIWYQGESNRGASDYFQKLQALSAGWSQIFQVKNIPILQAQIAPFDYSRGTNPNDSTLGNNIWAAQYRAAREIPGMGIIPLHDTITDLNNIHPQSKQPVGERLAALALKSQYGKNVVATGPSFASAKRKGPKVVVGFNDIGEGLVTSDGKAPTWFELSADGINFLPADAAIVGDTVELSAALLPEPKFVRMGWKDIALPNLKDKNGWPVFSFAAQAIAP